MLKELTCRECYIGFPAIGERYERKHLGLVLSYCLGMSYVISQHILLKFGPYIDACRTSTVARHSDNELRRCIYIYHNVQGLACKGTKSLFERVMYTVIDSNKTIQVARNARKQLQIDFLESPPTRFFRAAIVHPLKKKLILECPSPKIIATIWKAGWFTTDNLTRKQMVSCRNIGKKTFASFVALYHRTTFEPILTWLDTNINNSYDFVFARLARLEYPVRTAIPNLVIADVTHPSVIGEHNHSSFHDPYKRARIHRWKLNDYMFTWYSRY
ncbi:hypothetical protein I4U23_015901 [Adineta vaga]|nr:hypothetical protein I4U23_015901 [Adineta vaga]